MVSALYSGACGIVGENLINCRVVTCDGLASRPGEVEILLAASCYRNRDKLWQLWARSQLALRLHYRLKTKEIFTLMALNLVDIRFCV